MPRSISKVALARARAVTIRSFVAIICMGIGVLVTAQWRSVPTRVTNPVAPYLSLKETKDSLDLEQKSLKKEIQDLQSSLNKAQQDTQDITLTKAEIADLRLNKAQAGLTKLNGFGLIVTLDDSKISVASEDAIVHAADIRDILNLLWSSGAEGITINGQRVVINTAVDCIVNTVLVNDTRLSTPFVIEAVGNQSNMYEKITNQDLLTNLHQRQKNQGITFEIKKNNDLTLPIYDGGFETKKGGSVN